MIDNISKKVTQKLISFINEKDFSTSFYLIFFYLSVFMYTFSSLMNFIVELAPITIIIPLISASLNILFHILLFKRGKIYLCMLLDIINNNFIFSPFMWLTNLGFNGGFQYFIFMFMIFTIILLKGKSRAIVAILYILELLSLMILEAFNPALIVTLSGMESNSADMLVSLAMSTIAISITIVILSNLYRNEQERIIELTTTDPLTKQYNRRFIIELMEKMYNKPEDFELDKKYAVFIDIDDFKEINDQHGHNEGDRVLIEFCNTVAKHMRKTDYLARMGGDEFLLILNTETLENSKIFLNRLIKDIRTDNNITISAGLIKMFDKSGTVELLERADEKMYAAKRAGKNRFFSAEEMTKEA